MTTEHDRVVLQWISRARTRDGRPYRNECIGVFTVRDGKIRTVREYMDTLYAHDTAFGASHHPIAHVVDLTERLSRIHERWSPEVIARLNDYEVKLLKADGEFVWHSHDDTDELFVIIAGTLTIEMRDSAVTLAPGQLFVVPRGVEHRPVANGEVHAMLIEPAGVINTGTTGTAHHDERLV